MDYILAAVSAAAVSAAVVSAAVVSTTVVSVAVVSAVFSSEPLQAANEVAIANAKKAIFKFFIFLKF